MSRTLFEGVRRQLLRLIPRFGLSSCSERILDTYEKICAQSLLLKPGGQRPEGCRLNRDGTAIQFSLALARGRQAPLQFLGEAGAPAMNDAQRAAVGLQTITAVAETLGAGEETSNLLGILSDLTPETSERPNDNGPGVYWIGVSFPPEGTPALTVYVNTRGGANCDPWERSEIAASYLGAGIAWREIKATLHGKLTPLGVAFTVASEHPTSMREYFSAYGLRWCDYRDMFTGISGCELMGEFLDRYTLSMIGQDRKHPLRSAVCSFQFERGGTVNPKFELCAHCAYANDAEAAARCQDWIENEGLDSQLYADTVELLGSGESASPPELHAYVGIGMRRGEPYSTFYLNPGPGLAR